MDRTINVRLSGHDRRFELDEDAYKHLAGYLQRAGSRLDDAERAEVLGDLERSIGERLEEFGQRQQAFTVGDIDRVLEDVGPVETGRESAADGQSSVSGQPPANGQPAKRRLRRIREGQQIAGVCTGLAEYTQVDVDWMRTGWVLGALVTGGVLIVVYIALIFVLPIDEPQGAKV
jgi:phage shock protein PspC (stress-responsive transcriptional regulator)